MNDNVARDCPSVEVLAAFVEGNCTADERALVIQHLGQCDLCREITGEGAAFQRQEQPAAAQSASRRTWWIGVAAAVLIAFLVIPVVNRLRPAREPLHQLALVMPRTERTIEPRITGFAWAPLRSPMRSVTRDLEVARLKVAGEAGNVLEKAGDDPSPSKRHAAGVAQLVLGKEERAIEELEVAAQSNSAVAWSDLAAARYALAMREGRPAEFPRALAAADAALRVQPDHREALFNRALILERLGLRDEARRAWERYLSVDPSSEWSTEARQHLRR